MPFFNHPDFFANRQLDLENKLILPTTQLYQQIGFQLNVLYRDIRNTLIDAHGAVASAAKQAYDQPLATLNAWYEQTAQTGGVLYANTQAVVLPLYQDWQGKVSVGREKASRYWQAFWDNPEQATVEALAPATRYVTAAAEQSGQQLQLFLQNPEQYLAGALEPITLYLGSFSAAAEARLVSSYYALAELSGLLMAQPSATVQALYRNTLAALLDVYFELVSSLLVMA